MLFAKNNIQVAINKTLRHIDQGELWQGLDTWRTEGVGCSVATIIGKLYAPEASGLITRRYVPRSEKLVPNTATIRTLFGQGIRHYLEYNGITDQNARIQTGLTAGTYRHANKRHWHIDYLDAESPVLRFGA